METAASLKHAKQMLGHSYMSSTVDMTTISVKFADVPVDAFVIRAAAKAFRSAMNTNEVLNVSQVLSHKRRVTYLGVGDLRVAEIAAAGTENGPLPQN